MIFVKNYDVCGHPVAHFKLTPEEMREASKCAADDETPEGFCDLVRANIYTLDDVSSSREEDTVRHELGHYFLEASGLASFLAGEIKSKDYAKFEERFIRLGIPWLVYFQKANT